MRHVVASSFRKAVVMFGTLLPALALADNPVLTGPTESGLPVSTISGIVSNTMLWILGIFGFLAIIGFVIAGILYITAAGDEKQLGTAKTAAKWSIMGVIVALMGYVIVQAADTWLNGGSGF